MITVCTTRCAIPLLLWKQIASFSWRQWRFQLVCAICGCNSSSDKAAAAAAAQPPAANRRRLRQSCFAPIGYHHPVAGGTAALRRGKDLPQGKWICKVDRCRSRLRRETGTAVGGAGSPGNCCAEVRSRSKGFERGESAHCCGGEAGRR